MEVLLIFWVVSIIAGIITAGGKGAVWTFLLGPLGLVIVMLLPSDGPSERELVKIKRAKHERMLAETKICPFCAERVKTKAVKCKHCQSMLNE